MNVAPVSNYDKTTFGVFTKPPTEVVDEVCARLKKATPRQRDEFVERIKKVVGDNKNVNEEITQRVEYIQGEKVIVATVQNEEGEICHFYESCHREEGPLRKYISIMEEAGEKAKDVADLKESISNFKMIWLV